MSQKIVRNQKVVKTIAPRKNLVDLEEISGISPLSTIASERNKEKQKNLQNLLSETFQTKTLSESSLILMSRRDAIAKQLALSLLKPLIDDVVARVADGLVKGSFAELQEACEAVEEAEHRLTFELPLAPKYRGKRPRGHVITK